MNEVIRAAAELQTLCNAEDLIVFKAFAARPKDWVDLEGVLIRQADALDWPYVRAHLLPLLELKESPEVWDELQRRRKILAAP